MSMVTSNRLLPILAGSVLLLTVFVAIKSCSPDEAQPHLLDAVPQAPKPDADTPADTIKTLIWQRFFGHPLKRHSGIQPHTPKEVNTR